VTLTNLVTVTSNLATPNVSSLVTNIKAYLQIQAAEDTGREFGYEFAKLFYVGEVTIQNETDRPLLIYSSSLRVVVYYFLREKDFKKLHSSDTNGFKAEGRRPSTFSDILSIFEYTRRKNWRQQLVDYAHTAGELAVGATVFVGAPVYPKAVAFATGIFTPEMEKRLLWDLLLHAKNLESRSFKEIEEIPAFKPLTKLVFFPKSGIPGIWEGAPRIY